MEFTVNFEDLPASVPSTFEVNVRVEVLEIIGATHKIVCRLGDGINFPRYEVTDQFDPTEADPLKTLTFSNVNPGDYVIRAELIDVTDATFPISASTQSLLTVSAHLSKLPRR